MQFVTTVTDIAAVITKIFAAFESAIAAVSAFPTKSKMQNKNPKGRKLSKVKPKGRNLSKAKIKAQTQDFYVGDHVIAYYIYKRGGLVDCAGSWDPGVIIDIVKNGGAFVYTVNFNENEEWPEEYTDYEMGVHTIRTLNDTDRSKPSERSWRRKKSEIE